MAFTGGKLFVFEGPDGVGKSTLAGMLTRHLEARGENCYLTSFPGREAGTLGHLVYEAHHRPETLGIVSPRPISLQMLHVAAHLDAIESRILPALADGRHVILDRFWWSTWVYGLVGGANHRALRAMIRAEREIWGPTLPATAFLLTRTKDPSDDSGDNWNALSIVYRELAVSEMRQYPVRVVSNNESIEATLDQIIEFTSREIMINCARKPVSTVVAEADRS